MQVSDEMVRVAGVAMADSVALNYDHNKAIFDRYARAALTAALAAMWRPVSETKLNETSYLIATADGRVCEAAFYPKHGFWLDEYGAREDPWEGNAYHPVAIMPLPSPPKAEG